MLWTELPIGLLAGLALAAVGCSSDASPFSRSDASPPRDAAVDPTPVRVTPPSSDAAIDGPYTPCISTYRVTADCVHPVVEKQCANGFCTIPPGCFVMGSPECQEKRGAYSEPETQVTLTHRFELAQHEVTQGEWIAAGFQNNVKPPNPNRGGSYGGCLESDCPVNGLSWFDALTYANAMSRAHQPALPECYVLDGCTGTPSVDMVCTGARLLSATTYECKGYRLPTEAEWEYAARAGTRTPYYSGRMFYKRSDPQVECYDFKEPNLDKIAWYCGTASTREPFIIQTRPVMTKEPNGWGLYDMLGNVSEWASDAYTPGGYRKGPYVDLGARLEPGTSRATRGGGASSVPGSSTVSYRLPNEGNGLRGQGIRLARTLP